MNYFIIKWLIYKYSEYNWKHFFHCCKWTRYCLEWFHFKRGSHLFFLSLGGHLNFLLNCCGQKGVIKHEDQKIPWTSSFPGEHKWSDIIPDRSEPVYTGRIPTGRQQKGHRSILGRCRHQGKPRKGLLPVRMKCSLSNQFKLDLTQIVNVINFLL